MTYLWKTSLLLFQTPIDFISAKSAKTPKSFFLNNFHQVEDLKCRQQQKQCTEEYMGVEPKIGGVKTPPNHPF